MTWEINYLNGSVCRVNILNPRITILLKILKYKYNALGFRIGDRTKN